MFRKIKNLFQRRAVPGRFFPFLHNPKMCNFSGDALRFSTPLLIRHSHSRKVQARRCALPTTRMQKASPRRINKFFPPRICVRGASMMQERASVREKKLSVRLFFLLHLPKLQLQPSARSFFFLSTHADCIASCNAVFARPADCAITKRTAIPV